MLQTAQQIHIRYIQCLVHTDMDKAYFLASTHTLHIYFHWLLIHNSHMTHSTWHITHVLELTPINSNSSTVSRVYSHHKVRTQLTIDTLVVLHYIRLCVVQSNIFHWNNTQLIFYDAVSPAQRPVWVRTSLPDQYLMKATLHLVRHLLLCLYTDLVHENLIQALPSLTTHSETSFQV